MIDQARAERLVSDPRVIAAAWQAWRPRHQGRICPGPAFREAVAAALTALLSLAKDDADADR